MANTTALPQPLTRLVLITVENVGGKHLEECQVRVSYHLQGQKPYSKHSRFISCPPFSLLPDDVRQFQSFHHVTSAVLTNL